MLPKLFDPFSTCDQECITVYLDQFRLIATRYLPTEYEIGRGRESSKATDFMALLENYGNQVLASPQNTTLHAMLCNSI